MRHTGMVCWVCSYEGFAGEDKSCKNDQLSAMAVGPGPMEVGAASDSIKLKRHLKGMLVKVKGKLACENLIRKQS